MSAQRPGIGDHHPREIPAKAAFLLASYQLRVSEDWVVADANLVVFDFDGIHTADEVLNKLRSLQKEYLIDLEDACVVELLARFISSKP